LRDRRAAHTGDARIFFGRRRTAELARSPIFRGVALLLLLRALGLLLFLAPAVAAQTAPASSSNIDLVVLYQRETPDAVVRENDALLQAVREQGFASVTLIPWPAETFASCFRAPEGDGACLSEKLTAAGAGRGVAILVAGANDPSWISWRCFGADDNAFDPVRQQHSFQRLGGRPMPGAYPSGAAECLTQAAYPDPRPDQDAEAP